MSNHTNAPDREQITKWAQESGFTVRNGVIKVVHSNGSWVAVNDRLEEFSSIAFAAGQAAGQDVVVQRDRLLEALELMVSTQTDGGWTSAALVVAQAAIASVKGGIE